MSEAEDIMVYIKLAILLTISFALIYASRFSFSEFSHNVIVDHKHSNIFNILTVSSVTFVAYEGFQLVINGVNDMENPQRNIPLSIYIALIIVAAIYFLIALGAVLAVDTTILSKYQEYALSYGAKKALGSYAQLLVITGAVLATSSAINSTLYDSSHQMARIADDGYLPTALSKRKGTIPTNAMLSMSFIASLLVIIGGLKLILEFGSITFLIVSALMAYANFTIKDKTDSNVLISLISIFGLSMSIVFILYYELHTNITSLEFILTMYGALSLSAYLYSKFRKNQS